jgi:hypothetical protein
MVTNHLRMILITVPIILHHLNPTKSALILKEKEITISNKKKAAAQEIFAKMIIMAQLRL